MSTTCFGGEEALSGSDDEQELKMSERSRVALRGVDVDIRLVLRGRLCMEARFFVRLVHALSCIWSLESR